MAKPGCLAQMVDAYGGLGEGANIIAVEEVPPDQTHLYGVVGVGKQKGKAFEITGMVEKPPQGKAPSNLIISGRYILQPDIFAILEKQERGAGGEIQLTDAMITHAKSAPFFGYKFDGRTYRLRIEARLPRCECRLCAQARRHRAGVPQGAEAAAWLGVVVGV